ncbi:transposase [Streptomyces sp. 5K101]|uniref:transposase n=1 Tax=Streptomyces sp. 5K101 TaxID=3390037 RepID=UPI0039763287
MKLPPYAPDLNPVEGVWARLKKSLANLAPRAIEDLTPLVQNRLRGIQRRPRSTRRLHRRDRNGGWSPRNSVHPTLSTSASNAQEPPPITDSAGAPICAQANAEILGNFLFDAPGTLALTTGCAKRGYKSLGTPFLFVACQPQRTWTRGRERTSRTRQGADL